MLSIRDILSSNLLDNVWAITGFDIFVTLVLAFGMGMFIMLVYGRIYQGAMYSGSFAVSLVTLTMIATTLIMAVTSNLVLSLGMMGALSIVRFRTAIKDPLEIVFLFWAIETGIVLATGIFPLAIGANIVIGFLLLVLVVRKPGEPYILVLKCEEGALTQVKEILTDKTNYTIQSRKALSRSRAITGGENKANEKEAITLEFDIEVTAKNQKNSTPFDETGFVDDLLKVPGVSKAILVTYNGGYMS